METNELQIPLQILFQKILTSKEVSEKQKVSHNNFVAQKEDETYFSNY